MFSHPRYRPSLLSVHFKDLHAAPQRKSIIAEYELKLKESKNAGVKLDVEHHITLKDDIPVSAPARIAKERR